MRRFSVSKQQITVSFVTIIRIPYVKIEKKLQKVLCQDLKRE
ncbi:MarR family transcriptional regulator [Kosakonia quasisacchari]